MVSTNYFDKTPRFEFVFVLITASFQQSRRKTADSGRAIFQVAAVLSNIMVEKVT